MEQIRVADFIVDYLVEIGITNAFFLPGGGAMYLVDAFGKHPGIEVTACHHEQAVGIAAEACGRIQGNFGVAIVTTGPGATNIITPVTGAWIESVPMLILSGQVKRADMIRDSGLRQKGVQEVDIVTLVKSITKYAVTIKNQEDIKAELQKAVYLANTGRKGPVWLDIPLDVQAALIDSSKLKSFVYPQEERINIEKEIDKVIELINNSKRPLILAGHGIRLDDAAEEFEKLVEAFKIPAVFTWNALDLLAYDDPMYIGRPGVVALRAPNFAIQNCDLLIAIGCRIDNVITAFNSRGFAKMAKKVVVDIDEKELLKHEMAIEVKLQSGANRFIKSLLAQAPLIKPSFDDWIQTCLGWKRRYPVNDGKKFEHSECLSHYEFSDKISEFLPKNTIIVTGSSGLAVEIFYTVFRNKPGQRLFLTAGLGAMGYGLPAAIGACIGSHKRKVIAVESDGSLQLNIQELATIRSYRLPVCLIVLNNRGYASIRNTQRNYFEGRLVGTGFESGLWFSDLSKIAIAYEMNYYKICNVEDIGKIVPEALKQKNASIIDVFLNPDEILAPKVTAIPQKDGSMVSMPLEDMSPLLEISELQKEVLFEVSLESKKARNLGS